MIQIDMPMPTNCLDCPACNEYLTCAIPINGRGWGENDVREYGQSRPEWCPMKEQEDGYKNLLSDYEDLAREHQKLLEVKETMDIRDIASLWCNDITFCPEKCGWKSCPRNKENIRDRTIPHSFSVEIPMDCPKQEQTKRSIEVM